MYNIKINASPFTKEFIKTLRELNDYKINGYLNVLEVLNKEIDDISNRIKEIANYNEDAKLLMSIPGISLYSGAFSTQLNRRHKQVSRFRAFGFIFNLLRQRLFMPSSLFLNMNNPCTFVLAVKLLYPFGCYALHACNFPVSKFSFKLSINDPLDLIFAKHATPYLFIRFSQNLLNLFLSATFISYMFKVMK